MVHGAILDRFGTTFEYVDHRGVSWKILELLGNGVGYLGTTWWLLEYTGLC